MKKEELNEMAGALADALRGSVCTEKPELSGRLLHLLAEGHPVSPEQIAASLDLTREDASAVLRRLPSVELDDEGNVIGILGLTINPTPHCFRVDGQGLFTWCALDSLFLPAALGKSARVESPCPVTGTKIQITVSPDGVEGLEPAGAVMAIIIPDASEACCNIRDAFCDQVHFFSSPEAASEWVREHEGAAILSVDDAHTLGLLLIENIFFQT